ncbi:hypothetical protein FV242_06240, partial [Methylobacterium sp. WL64]
MRRRRHGHEGARRPAARSPEGALAVRRARGAGRRCAARHRSPTVRIDPPVRPATSGCVIVPRLRPLALLALL